MGPVTFTNLVFCVIIVTLGYLGYRKMHLTLPILIGVAFGLFGVSHLLTLLSITNAVLLIPIRALAYLIVIFALAQFLRAQKAPVAHE
jgi:lipopolysaccharide export LptBFGC system permease protein LptF